MKCVRIFPFLLFCLGVLFCAEVYACEVTDDAGHLIHLSQPANRIISLAPDLTELLFESGAGDKIAGVMQGSDYPAAAKKLPVIASYNSLNAEAILALHPDLIIAWSGNSVTQLAWFSHLKIPVFISHQRKLTDIPLTLQKFGCLAGTEKTAKDAALRFTQKLNALREQYQTRKEVSVFYEISSRPLMTVNQESWINQVITLCGGKNIFANATQIAPVVSREAVLIKNPQFILGRDVSEWQSWPQLQSVKKHQIFALNPDLLERAGPRLLQGAETVCHLLSSGFSQPA